MDKIQRAKKALEKEKAENEHDQLTLRTDKVSFFHAFKMFWRQGRHMNIPTSRHNYWYMLVWQWLIKIITLIIATVAGSSATIASIGLGDSGHNGSSAIILFGLMFGLIIILSGYVLVTFIPMLTMTMRRYKDTGLSRFWGFLVYAIIGILVLVYLFSRPALQSIAISLFIVFALGNLIICSLPRGVFVPKGHKK